MVRCSWLLQNPDPWGWIAGPVVLDAHMAQTRANEQAGWRLDQAECDPNLGDLVSEPGDMGLALLARLDMRGVHDVGSIT
jgi:hypothetical protein